MSTEKLDKSQINLDATELGRKERCGEETPENDVGHLFNVGKQSLSPFMEDAPDLWFLIIESEFQAWRIKSDDIKYTSVLKALDRTTLNTIADVLRDPPAKDRYENIKKVIINRLSESRSKQLDKLLKSLSLDNKKPSQLLREMTVLANKEISNDIIHKLWLERLPHNIRTHLVITEKSDLDTIAELADKLMDVCGSNYVMATSKDTTDSKLEKLNNILISALKEIRELKAVQLAQQQDIEQLKSQPSHYNQSTQFQRRPRSRTPSKSHVCYYHIRFGEKSKKCTAPCLFTNKVHPEN